MLNSQGQSTSLISVAASLAIASLVMVNLEEAWENHKFRVHVSNVLAEAETSAPLSVALNAKNGLPLDLGWGQTKPSIDDGLVSISAESGIITVSLGAEVDSGKRNLKLVPISNNNVLKVTDGLVAKDLDWSKVIWVCTSSGSKYSFNIPEEGRGSLPSRFAPAKCR